MRRKVLTNLLKAIVLGGYVLGFFVCATLVPRTVNFLAYIYPVFARHYQAAIGYCYLLATPIFIALGIAWMIFVDIGRDRSFTETNARRLRWVYRLALVDLALLIAGFIWTAQAGIYDPLTVLCFTIGLFLCAAAAILCLVLSQLIQQATLLKLESDYTI